MQQTIINTIVTVVVTAVVTGALTYAKTTKKNAGAIKSGVLSLLRLMIIQHHHKYTDQGYCSINDKDIIEKAYKAYHNLSFIITIFVVLNKNERKSFMLLFQNLLNKIR